MNKNELFRNIPSVSKLLETGTFRELSSEFGEGLVKFLLRKQLDSLRNGVKEGNIAEIPEEADLAESLRVELRRICRPEGRRAVNAAGIMLHTGLGRAPYAQNALEALNVFDGYSILQTDIETGRRSVREERIEQMLIELTGCEAATVINNNAEATMLALNTLAEGREAIISRGQLVEIGGSFRMPEVMKQSGAVMVEVGTTNKTHISDYKTALTENTGVIIHAHTSNYRVRGFSSTPDIRELCEFRNEECPEVPVLDDLGSGALVPLSEWGLPDEPLVRDSLAAGADIACFSGDKLVSGPQGGILCGKKDIIQKIRKNPYARMFRTDKMMLAVLEATLIHFLNEDYEQIPLYRMLSRTLEDLEQDALKLAGVLKGLDTAVEDDESYVGSGSNPDQGVPTKILKVKGVDAEKASSSLRKNLPSIFCRIKDDSLCFDMRTLLNDDLDVLCRDLPSLLVE